MKKWLEDKKDTIQGREANEKWDSSFRGQVSTKKYSLNCLSSERRAHTRKLIVIRFNHRFLETSMMKRKNALMTL